jgi:hypothetical protein
MLNGQKRQRTKQTEWRLPRADISGYRTFRITRAQLETLRHQKLCVGVYSYNRDSVGMRVKGDQVYLSVEGRKKTLRAVVMARQSAEDGEHAFLVFKEVTP